MGQWAIGHNAQKPLELILARNLLTSISTPAFLVDAEGVLLFYNEAGPFTSNAQPIPLEELPLTIALREGRPAHSAFRIRSAAGDEHDIEVSAFPIAAAETSGAIAIFWPADVRAEDGEATR